MTPNSLNDFEKEEQSRRDLYYLIHCLIACYSVSMILNVFEFFPWGQSLVSSPEGLRRCFMTWILFNLLRLVLLPNYQMQNILFTSICCRFMKKWQVKILRMFKWFYKFESTIFIYYWLNNKIKSNSKHLFDFHVVVCL